jgi:hypothetical protein
VVSAVAKAAGPIAVAYANLGPQITPLSIPAGQAPCGTATPRPW